MAFTVHTLPNETRAMFRAIEVYDHDYEELLMLAGHEKLIKLEIARILTMRRRIVKENCTVTEWIKTAKELSQPLSPKV